MNLRKGSYSLLTIICCLAYVSSTSAQTTLYARQSASWNVSATWSTIGPGGAACMSCVPTALDSVVINGFAVTLDADGDCKSLNVFSGSSLTFSNGFGLDVNSGTVELQAGGTLTHSGAGSAAHLDFEAGTNQFNVAATATCQMEDINIAGSSTVTLSGAGDIDLTDDLTFIGAGGMVTNDLTGTLDFTVPGFSALKFTTASSGCTFINNGTVNIAYCLLVQGINTTITNNGTMTLPNASFGITATTGDAAGLVITNGAGASMTIAGRIAMANNQMIFNNHGTLDLEGDLNGWSPTAPSEFHNFSGSVFNFGGTGNFYGRFFADYDANLVVYDNATTLQNELIAPADNYWHITFSGFQKQIKTSILAKGDVQINTNVFITATRNITMDNGGTFTIASGGSLTRSTSIGRLYFSSNHTYNMVVDDATTGFAWDFVEIYSDAVLNISGAGLMNMDDAVYYLGDNSTVNNNMTGTFTMGQGILFPNGTSGNHFVNNGPITLGIGLILNGANNDLTNHSTLGIVDDMYFFGTGCGLSNSASGTITLGDDLFFSSSIGNKLNNAGLFTIPDRVDFAGQMDTIQNSGTFSVGGLMRVAANTNDDNVTINQAGGVLNVVGDFQLNDADYVLDNYGTFNLTGRFDDMAGVDSIFNRSGAVINYNGIHNTVLNTEISLYADFDSNEFNYLRNDGLTQFVFPAADAYWHLNLSGSGDKETVGNIDVNGDLNISGTANFDANTGNDNISLAGDWTSTSTFDEGTETVTFDGAADQTINTTGGETFSRWVINKSAGTVIMACDVTASNSLTLTNGPCDLNGQTLTTTSPMATAVIRTNGYLISEQTDHSSKLVRNVGSSKESFLFPFGRTDGTYIPFTLELTNGDIGTVTVSTYGTGTDNLPWPTAPDAVLNLPSEVAGLNDNMANTIDRFWQIDKTGVSGTADITFTYADGEASSGITGSESLLQAQRYNKALDEWESALTGQVTDAVGNTVLVPDVTAFSPWTLAISTAPLPITLLNFDAQPSNEVVELTWSTATEAGNDFFTIEKSVNGQHFIPVMEVPGAGYSNSILHYSATDYDRNATTTYYRLKQTDFDGQYAYSHVVAVEYDGNEELSVQMFPNPVAAGESLSFEMIGGAGTLELEVRDVQGRLCMTGVLNAESAYQIVEIDLPENLRSGYYIVTGTNAEQSFRDNLIVR